MSPDRKFGRQEYMNFYSYNYTPAHGPQTSIAAHHFPLRRAVMAVTVFVFLLAAGRVGLYWRANRLVVTEPTVAADTPATISPPQPTPQLPAAVPSLSPSTTPAAGPTEDKQLKAILQTWATNHPANSWSIVVHSLGDDQRFASYNGDDKASIASIYKLFLTYPLLQKVALDKFATTYISVDGANKTVGDCVDAMLRYSDNDCGIAVGQYVGWANADKILAKAGFSQTQLNNAAGPMSSASDTAKLLGELYGGGLYTDQQRQYILDILKQQTIRNGIPAGCKGCVVADKTGELPSVSSDAGIVYYLSDTYSLVIFSNGASFSDIATLTSQIQAHMAS